MVVVIIVVIVNVCSSCYKLHSCDPLLNFPERREIAAKFDIVLEDGAVTAFSRCFHGDLKAISRRSLRFYGAPWRSYGVQVGDCLRSHGAPTALTAFCLYSEVVEITGRVLISQLRQ